MREKIVLFSAAAMMALAGCRAADTAMEKTSAAGSQAKTQTVSNNLMEKETSPRSVQAESEEASAVQEAVKGLEDRQYTWQEITVTLPEDWVGRCVIREDEYGFSYYQKASYETDDTLGYVCGFFRTDEPVEYDHGRTLIAYTDDGTLYYMMEPTDVPCDTEDEKIAGEYLRMCQQVPQLKNSLQIAASGVHGNADEYLLPTSSIFELDPSEYVGLPDNFLWIARNEIYARHGRQFDNMYLQQYFDRCTWYEGTIPAAEFQESVLNQTERKNLQLLAAEGEAYARQHPYPQMHQASENVMEDLDGDGVEDGIGYQIAEQENGEVHCMITVNGEIFNASELSCSDGEMGMTNPMYDCYYTTDILENDGNLEIAVLDEGPSDDPVTYFFQYDGMLTCIGWVPGFPFAEMNEGLNGFDGQGGITGCLRADLIETADVQKRWWYDGSRIIDLDVRWYDYWPSYGHVLYEDLPVHYECEETSPAAVIPAQEEVYFLGTDMERWILVKGKDGNQGYMLVEDEKIVELDKLAEEVFSGLQFSG